MSRRRGPVTPRRTVWGVLVVTRGVVYLYPGMLVGSDLDPLFSGVFAEVGGLEIGFVTGNVKGRR